MKSCKLLCSRRRFADSTIFVVLCIHFIISILELFLLLWIALYNFFSWNDFLNPKMSQLNFISKSFWLTTQSSRLLFSVDIKPIFNFRHLLFHSRKHSKSEIFYFLSSSIVNVNPIEKKAGKKKRRLLLHSHPFTNLIFIFLILSWKNFPLLSFSHFIFCPSTPILYM